MALKSPSINQLRSRVAQERELGTDSRMEKVADAVIDPTSPKDIVDQINVLWEDAQRRFVAIGRYLLKAQVLVERQTKEIAEKKKLAPKEARAQARAAYEEEVVKKLPFSDKVASQLACVARAIDSGRLREHELPSSYSIAYQLTTLTDQELEAARENNIVRRNVQRDEVVAFKRRLREQSSVGVDREVELRKRRRRIAEEIERLQAELRQIDRELGAVTIDCKAKRVEEAVSP
jgi:hypothetical protein